MDEIYIPDWIIELLEEKWLDIDQAVSSVLYSIGELPIAGPSALENIDPTTDVLGCGFMGCVLPLNTDRFVLKISGDITEGPLISLIMHDPELRPHPGIAFYLAIWQTRDLEYNEPVYIILREAIEPFSKSLEKAKIAKLLNAYQKITKHIYQIRYWLKKSYLLDKAKIKKYEKQLITKIQARQRTLRKLAKITSISEVVDFINIVEANYDIMLADVHSDNIGEKLFDSDEFWTIFDVGMPVIVERTPKGLKILNKTLEEYAKTIPYLRE